MLLVDLHTRCPHHKGILIEESHHNVYVYIVWLYQSVVVNGIDYKC